MYEWPVDRYWRQIAADPCVIRFYNGRGTHDEKII